MPFAPLVNEYFWATLPPEWGVHDVLSCCKAIGADTAERWVQSYVGLGLHFSPDEGTDWAACGVRRIEQKDGVSTGVRYETPVGTLSERLQLTTDAGQTWFRSEHLVKTADDLRVYQYLWECGNPRPAYHKTRTQLDHLGDNGIAMGMTPCTPILHLIMYDLGLERTSYFLADYPQAMNRLMEVMTEKVLAATRLAARSPIDVGIIPENSGTLLVSPAQFRTYCAPVLSEMVRIFHENGKQLLLHACGHLRDLLPQITATGLDGIESLTPPPTGNVELSYAREVLGPDKTIMGGLDPVWFACASPEEVEARVETIVEQVRPGRHFMLMPSDSTPANVPLANFAAVLRAIERTARWLG